MDLQEILDAAPANQLIRNTFIKADKLLNFYKNPVVSISGGADSDIMLDLVEKIRNGRPISYVFFDTGIEYSATKNIQMNQKLNTGLKSFAQKQKFQSQQDVKNMESLSYQNEFLCTLTDCKTTTFNGKMNRMKLWF